MQEDPNYGRQDEESRLRRVPLDKDGSSGGTSGGPFGGTGGSMGTTGMAGPSGTMSVQDERTWSMLAHLSILLDLISGIGGPIAALVIWLLYKDRSPRVGFHALQSLWYQVAWIVILAVGWIVTSILMLVFIGFLLIPVMALASLVPFVHQCYAAYKVYQGVDYRYPFIADMVDKEHRFG
ncbi:MAG TPA: DUF4870 domain-containing protein [Rubrobacteraceae bacterium]|nr:DUF4870 domain-containing protein [Rubrobacteraceae bacterium]